ncbi:MAG TPA: ATP-binding protein [Tepidisphaeraceae bacterium]|nr:ATP-binding protein [Tepidisphaeraceae bacterium]
MFGLRQKLLMGFGGLLLILLTVSGLSIGKFLWENWRSVVYGHHMVDALAQLDSIAQPLGKSPSPAAIAAAGQQAAAPLKLLGDNVWAEDHNITLVGEDQLAAGVTLLWNGDDLSGKKQTDDSYLDNYQILINPQAASMERSAAFAALHRLSPMLRAKALGVISLNSDYMKPISLLVMLAATGVLVAVIFTMVVARSILRPIETLTRSARQIESGNLDLVIQLKSRDELRQLAEAFNSMAAKLREYRRTNRAKLARTQQTTQNAINSLPDAVAIVSPDGTVEMANTAAQRLFALRPGEHVSTLHVEWLVSLFDKVCSDLRPIEPRGYDSAIQVLDEGGGEKFFLPHAVPILDGDGALLGVTVVLADVTNLRRLDEMKSGMLSVVSHELKTPLTSIRMGVHLLLEERLGPLTAQQNDILVAVREDSDRLNEIIHSLLDIGRIEAGRALMDLQTAPAEKIITEAIDSFSAAYHDKGVELSSDIPADLPPVMVDSTRIDHVLTNLLGNALKYTPPGGQVTIAAREFGDFVKITVTDTGPGIPRQYIDRIFERFFRVPGQAGGTGAGLGLAIAREIIEAHGGQMSVESSEGSGSKFSFTLRRAHDDAQPAQTPDEAVAS